MALSAAAGIAIEWISVFIALVFVATRLWIRWCQQWHAGSTLSDGFIIFAMVIFIAVTACDTENFHIGLWSTNEDFAAGGPGIEDGLKRVPDKGKLTVVFKLFYAAGPLFYVCMWCVKAAMLLFYYSLIPRTLRHYRQVTHVVSVVVGISFLVMLYLNFLYCYPVSRNWSLDPEKVCYSWPAYIPYFTSLALHYSTDLLILILPFPILRFVTLSPHDKIGVGIMFALGILTIVSTTARTVCLNKSFNIPLIGVWSAIEMATGIVVTCCPPLKWLYRSSKIRKLSAEQYTLEGKNISKSDGTAGSRMTDGSGVIETIPWTRVVASRDGPDVDIEGEGSKWNVSKEEMTRLGTSGSFR